MSTLFNTRNPLSLGGMDALLATNRDHFSTQVSLFQPPPRTANDIARSNQAAKLQNGGVFGDADTVIATRVRPLLEREVEIGSVAGVVERGWDGWVDVFELRNKVTGRPAVITSSFQFNKAYGPTSSSETIYDDLVKPLVPWAWGGGVSTLFAYGQTGSGKTFTVDALARGAAEELFAGGLEGEREVYLSCFELAGNVASDLLNDHQTIKILEDSYGEIQLVGALTPLITSTTSLLDHLNKSLSHRKTSATLKNDTSSRTHFVCRLKIVNKSLGRSEADAAGLLFLIDLAGSEAASDTRNHGVERMKESREINASLSILKDCIRGRSLFHIQESQAVSANSKTAEKVRQAHIPYRNSALTKVLKHVFDTKGLTRRHCKTAVIACVGSSYFDAASAKNTLRYAELLSVPVPAFKVPNHDDRIPTTWGNEFVKTWIEKNSGTPSIDANILAPTENGIQLCRLPAGEFISRCLKTPGIDTKHARAFYEKLLGAHIDSRKLTQQNKSKSKATTDKQETADDLAERMKVENAKPYFERLRAGMFVELRKIYPKQDFVPVYLILSPESGFTGMYGEEGGRKLTEFTNGDIKKLRGQGEKIEFGKGQRYICAEVAPAPMPSAYEIDVRRQRLIAVEEMDRELLMDYDHATRYYYMTV